MARKYEVYACVEEDCGYYRDEKSTGIHMSAEMRNGFSVSVSHGLESATAIDERDVEPLVAAVRDASARTVDDRTRNELTAALKAFEAEEDSGG